MASVNRAAGLGQTATNDIISGKSGSATLATVEKIATAFGVPPLYMLQDPDESALRDDLKASILGLPEADLRRILAVALTFVRDQETETH